MKIITHTALPKGDSIFIKTEPLSIWLTKTKEMQIESGDTVEIVAREVRRYWNVDKPISRQLAAYFFALGERVSKGGVSHVWARREIQPDPDRRYEPIANSLAKVP